MKNSLSPQQEKLEQLKQLLPEVFTEGRVDWEKLKLSLGEDINIKNERYVLNWAGKSNAYKVLQEPTSKTLSPDKSESVDFDKTENLFIEGDNLEALKILQKSYFGKVKMIYIDPPYNTGNDSFIYPDRFKENLENYQKNVGDKDEDGYLIQDSIFKKNRKENGQYHSNWLNMMMPRLYLAKNLLRKDGVIFISIDDNEVYNLRLLMNEIFGEENFVGLITVQSNPRGSQASKYISNVHEYILIFSRQKELVNIRGEEKSDTSLKEYSEIDENGYKYRLLGLRQRGGAWKKEDRPSLHYPIYIQPDTGRVSIEESSLYTIKVIPKRPTGELGRWTWSKKKLSSELGQVIGKPINRKENTDVWDIFRKDYLLDINGRQKTTKVKTIWMEKENNYQNAKNEIKFLFDNSEMFSFPKPIYILKKLILMLDLNYQDIILDFFAGSGTTAHAVMQLNAEDGGSRKCISIQLPEICEEKSEAFKAGYKTIADIAKERIRRAGKKIKEDNKDKENIDQLDIGFKVLKVSDSNFREWRTDISSEKLDEQLDLHVDPIAEDASTENMVYELMLKNGKDLNSHIKHHNHIYSISDQENHDENILVLLLEKVNEDVIENVLQENPNKVIALDKLFKNNDQLKTNTALQMQDADIKFETI